MAAKLVSVLSARMAMRLNSLSLQKKFSIRWRHLYISSSMARGCARRGCCEMTILAPRAFEIGDDGVAVEGLVGDQRVEGQSVDERRHADRVEALSRQQDEAHEIAERIGEGQDFGGHAAFRTADGLALSPPFAPCPWRWTLTMVASTMAYSMSGSSETASKSRFEDIGLHPVAEAREHGVPVAERRRQIAPWAARARDPQHRLDKKPVVLAAAPGFARLAETVRLHLRPLGVSQNESIHPCTRHGRHDRRLIRSEDPLRLPRRF